MKCSLVVFGALLGLVACAVAPVSADDSTHPPPPHPAPTGADAARGEGDAGSGSGATPETGGGAPTPTGADASPPPFAKHGALTIEQAIGYPTIVRSFAYRARIMAQAPIPFGAECERRQTPLETDFSELLAPAQLTFTGGLAVSPLTLAPVAPSKIFEYRDASQLGSGGSGAWLSGGEILLASSSATSDVPAIVFPSMAWPSRVSLVESAGFRPTMNAGVRAANSILRSASLEVAWALRDQASAGTVLVSISRSDNSFAIDCRVAAGTQVLHVPPAALSALGPGAAYLGIRSFSRANVSVPGFADYFYLFDQSEDGVDVADPNRAFVHFDIL